MVVNILSTESKWWTIWRQSAADVHRHQNWLQVPVADRGNQSAFSACSTYLIHHARVYWQILYASSDFTCIIKLYMHRQTSHTLSNLICNVKHYLYYHTVSKQMIKWSTTWLCSIQAFHYSMPCLTFWQISSDHSMTTLSNVPQLTHSSAFSVQQQATWYGTSSHGLQMPSNHLPDLKPCRLHADHG